MSNNYKVSFYTLLALIFLLPIFFLPARILPLDYSKTALIALLAIVAFASFLVDTLRHGKLESLWHPALLAVVLLPLAYLLSSLKSASKSLSLWGYGFDVGTFAYIVIAFVLMWVIAQVFADASRILKALSALFLSLFILALFAAIKIFSGTDTLTLGTFFGNMGNPVGRWTDYAAVFALLSLLSVLALEMLSLKKSLRILLYVSFILSLVLMAVINFSVVTILALALGIVVLVYFMTVEKQARAAEGAVGEPTYWPAALLVLVCLLFVFNPVVSPTYGKLADFAAGRLNIANTDVRPSLGTTFGISRSVLKESALLGSGPNTFSRDWFLYKPAEINATTFWNASFPFGLGFLPTQIANTGLLGTLLWILFLGFFLHLGYKVFSQAMQSRGARFINTATFLGALFLWILSFLYAPSTVVLTLAFIFTGLFIAAARISGVVHAKSYDLAKSNMANFASLLLVIALGIGALSLGLVGYQRVASASHLQKAMALSQVAGTAVDDIEGEISKAIRLAPADIYYSAIAELNFSRASAALNATEGTAAENQAIFQNSLAKSISAAQAATQINPESYGNWITLGQIYASLVPAPLSVEGAYESAIAAYKEAEALHPLSPAVPLFLARLEFSKGNIEAARTYANESVRRKADFADAHFFLTQLEASQNNIPQAIKSAETAALLSPGNAGAFFQLGALKYTNNDFAGAREALSQAIVLLPNYANAQYFLALSQFKLGQKEEAQKLFEELLRTNPDNEELAKILANIRAGKDPLFQIPSATSPSRQTPPITEPAQ